MNFRKYSEMFQHIAGMEFNSEEVKFYFHQTGLGGTDFLDVGCGDSLFIKKYLEENSPEKIDYVGLDLFTKRKDVVQADMHDLPFKKETFSDVLMMNVLEHSVAPFIAIHEAHRVLKKRGILHILLPVGLGHELFDEEHFIVPSEIQINNLLSKAGFHHLTTKRYGTIVAYTGYKNE